jgi:hypothetical protein
MHAEDVECYIPSADICVLTKMFEKIKINKNGKVSFIYAWEEDCGEITGTLEKENIILDSCQSGTFKNSSDGGLSILLEKYKGDGIIRESGEDGESSVCKYVKGVEKKGKVMFED